MTDPIARTFRGMLAADPDIRQIRVAQSIGKNQSTVHRYAQGSAAGGLDLPALLVPAVTAELGDDLIEMLCRLCHGQFVRTPSNDIEASCVEQSVRGVVAAAAYQAQAVDAEKDQRVTREEHVRLLQIARQNLEFAQERVTYHEAALRKIIAEDTALLRPKRRTK